ncbi:MAG: helicase RepA family protein [Pseudomonadota bacterium]
MTARARAIADGLQHIVGVEPVSASNYLVKGWLDQGALSVVYGESNVGKSFFAMDLALHVASGVDWHGFRVDPKQDPVVYFAAEGGVGIANRIEAARRERSHIVENAEFNLLRFSLDLCGPQDVLELQSALKTLPFAPSLIVVDTVARVMGAGDENTAKDMGALVANLDRLRGALGSHVMLIHHSGKDTSKGARGSSALRAAVDTEIKITRVDDVIQAETQKQRDMECGAVFAYRLQRVEIGTDSDGDPITSAVVQATEPVEKKPKLTGQQGIGLQALDEALAEHGARIVGDNYPLNRRCVTLQKWREYCDRHALSSGESDSARRKAFFSVKNALHEKGIIRVFDDNVWRCEA